MSVQATNPETLSLEERAAIVETSEARWFEAIYDGFSPDIMAEYGATYQDVGGGTAEMFEDLARVSNVYSYVAYAGDEPAGAGSMIVNGEFCHLFNAATLPEFRRRGAQSAIMARRIEEGIKQGCRWFMTETDEDTPENSNPSYRNMLRTGFQLAYLRPNYAYGPETAE
jgi:ribosomal protein S18 acetylase RimI-like enzyme